MQKQTCTILQEVPGSSLQLQITLEYDVANLSMLSECGTRLTKLIELNKSPFVIPLLCAELNDVGFNTTVKVIGGIFNPKRYLTNLILKLAESRYNRLGRDAYIKRFNLEVP